MVTGLIRVINLLEVINLITLTTCTQRGFQRRTFKVINNTGINRYLAVNYHYSYGKFQFYCYKFDGLSIICVWKWAFIIWYHEIITIELLARLLPPCLLYFVLIVGGCVLGGRGRVSHQSFLICRCL